MNNHKNNPHIASGRKPMPFFVEFVKFAAGFAVIVAVALFVLQLVNAFGS